MREKIIDALAVAGVVVTAGVIGLAAFVEARVSDATEFFRKRREESPHE